jgi:N-acetylmuramoyl-L-alanine amidase
VFGHRYKIRLSQHLRTLAVCLVCLVSMPIDVLASLDIAPGQTAVVSGTDGDPINLRARPHTASRVLGEVHEGDVVEVIDGPTQDDSGMWWYKVVASGTRAWISADFLSVSESAGGQVGAVTGTAAITNTGGDPINCRSGAGAEYSVVYSFVEGNVLELTGERIGPWQPVNCGGEGGYVHSDFIAYAGDAPEPDVSAEATRATIVNTGGDPINCRADAGTFSAVLTTVYEGERVALRGNRVANWQPVSCNGQAGFVEQSFLSTTNSGGGSTGGSNWGLGVIANTNGQGLNCRTRASFSGAVIVVLREGAKVRLRGAERNGWQPIMCAHAKGWVASEFVEIGDGGSTPQPPSDPGPSTDLRAGDSAVVANTNGEGLRLRSKASSGSSIITVLAEGTKLEVRRGSTGDWVAVTYRTSNGFVHMDYLRKVTDQAPPPPDPDTDSGLGKGDHAELIDDMNFRDAPGMSGSIITTMPEGTVVLVTGSRQNGFYPVEAAGFAGYLHGDYLKRTDKDVSDGTDDPVGGQPGDGPMTPQGRKMIDYAQRFLGYPYVWATHGPDTFDCSGFTYYVTIKTLKQDIGAGTWSQSISGTPVAYGDLRPGDLVFFQNTFTWGLSHVGIYIGDGKFIHAENERTGVVISSLTSTYYKTRWYGARRLTTD